MKKFRCLYDGGGDRRLTIGKIYDVSHNGEVDTDGEYITIIDNVGDETTYYIYTHDPYNIWFINIEKDRDKKIEKILKKYDKLDKKIL